MISFLHEEGSTKSLSIVIGDFSGIAYSVGQLLCEKATIMKPVGIRSSAPRSFRRLAHAVFCIAALGAAPTFAQQAMSETITVLAAGSLRDAMKDLAAAFQKESGVSVTTSYGPSGKLRSEIEAGRKADVFASAAVEHTEALAKQKLLSGSTVFAYNDLCIVSRPELGLNHANLVDVLKKPSVRVGTSTPVSDPMGDYTWDFFRKADKLSPGTFAVLDSKALKLSGASAPAPDDSLPYVTAFEDNKVDAYIMYCTNAAGAKNALPDIGVLRIPDELNVRSAYGIGAYPSSSNGERFVKFVLGPAGRGILRQHGFH